MRVRLRTKSPTEKPARVDREGAGRILGASIMAKGEALGHGFWIDDTTLDQVAALAEGASGRWTHGNLCADGLGTHLGRWHNVRREGDRVLGDFHFSQLAKSVQPEGLGVDAPTYLMDAAEKEPDVVGVSAVIDVELVEADEADEDDEDDEDENESDDEDRDDEREEPRLLARVQKVPRADYVADPAANPDGLFGGTPSELSDRATFVLTEAESIYGRDKVAAFLRAHLGQNTPEATVKLEELKKKHAEELAAKDAALAEAQAKLAAHEKAEAARLEAEDKAFVERLHAASASAQNPLDKADVAKVEAHLKAGNRAFARELGEVLLKGAEKEGGKPVKTVAASAAPKDDSREAAAKRGVERLRSRAGLKKKTTGKE